MTMCISFLKHPSVHPESGTLYSLKELNRSWKELSKAGQRLQEHLAQENTKREGAGEGRLKSQWPPPTEQGR